MEKKWLLAANSHGESAKKGLCQQKVNLNTTENKSTCQMLLSTKAEENSSEFPACEIEGKDICKLDAHKSISITM